MNYSATVKLDVPASYAFAWHARPGALARLLPPWEGVKIHSSSGGIRKGDRVEVSVPIGPLHKRWLAEHRDYVEGEYFSDVQLQGPFARWEHTHRFEPLSETSCLLHDEIEYELPLGNIGRTLGSRLVRQKLRAMFRFRHERTKADLEQHFLHQAKPRLKVLISGSTGMIGSAFIPFLTTGGHEVYRLVRDEKHAALNPRAIYWDIGHGEVDRQRLEGFDAVIHLAGAGIAGHRWTPKYKELIKSSRVRSTQLLSGLLATLHHKPKVLISSSAIGYYGNRGEEPLTEQSTSGVGFLPEVGRAWEEAARTASEAGIRVVHPRLGIVLSPTGGALKEMLTPFRWGMGGIVGSGRQYWSSISLDDVLGAIYHCLMTEDIHGPVNLVMPQSTTNREFIKTLGEVLQRPTLVPLPTFAVRTLLGEMGSTLLLDSTRVAPARLQQSGYKFRHPNLDQALRFLLGKYSHPQATPPT
ncbi:MAG: TIGR01777 family oxidoreductase [Planctomycetaceae bacterium]|nr:TIGR01777 family oxidoreductase [Planctomycetaceae bacterium]